jgi:hypothetical protein
MSYKYGPAAGISSSRSAALSDPGGFETTYKKETAGRTRAGIAALNKVKTS